MAIYNLQAKVMKTALLTMLITTIAIPETYAAGRTANSIANTVLSGAGVPAKSLGINGDFYIDTKTMNMYGPKKNNSWPLPDQCADHKEQPVLPVLMEKMELQVL